jgi:hypothetical protein
MSTTVGPSLRGRLKKTDYPDAPMEGWVEHGPLDGPLPETAGATQETVRTLFAERGLLREQQPAVINGATVEAYLTNAKALANDEETRGASLKQRAGLLLGFEGVMLGILLTQASQLTSDRLGAVGTPIAGVLVAVGVLLLIDAARYALQTLSIVKVWHVGPEESDRYCTYEFLAKDVAIAQGEMLRGWTRQFSEARTANDGKAEQLQVSFTRLLLSMGTLSGVALIACIRALGV